MPLSSRPLAGAAALLRLLAGAVPLVPTLSSSSQQVPGLAVDVPREPAQRHTVDFVGGAGRAKVTDRPACAQRDRDLHP